MSDFLILGLIVAVIAIFVFFAKDKKSSTEISRMRDKKEGLTNTPEYKNSKQFTQKNEYAAVSIAQGANACKSVRALENTRFLVREAPLLPIRGCTNSKACECQYLHHTDRRTVNRRTRRETTTEPVSNNRQDVRRDEDRAKHG